MNEKVIRLAYQLLNSMPSADVTLLIRILNYYNNNFTGSDRAKAMRLGSQYPSDRTLEEDIRGIFKAGDSQTTYVMATTDVCRCCGK